VQSSSDARRGCGLGCRRLDGEPATNSTTRPQRSLAQWFADMPRWKKGLLLGAIATAAVGGVLSLGGGDAGTAPSGGAPSGAATSLLAGQPTTGGATNAGEEPAAKGVFRLGFSFVAGFCLGSFVRATLRIAAIAFGFWLLLTMALAHYGILVVDWNAMSSLWDRFAANVEQEWGSVQRFLTGSLPAAGLAATGLVVGLRRH
jgi:uncharacterized membrane protein (Fun14 family)